MIDQLQSEMINMLELPTRAEEEEKAGEIPEFRLNSAGSEIVIRPKDGQTGSTITTKTVHLSCKSDQYAENTDFGFIILFPYWSDPANPPMQIFPGYVVIKEANF